MLKTQVYIDVLVANAVGWALFWAAFFPWILVIPFQTRVPFRPNRHFCLR